eukprot:358308-Chlamydomonas_euryale.AAC.14
MLPPVRFALRVTNAWPDNWRALLGQCGAPPMRPLVDLGVHGHDPMRRQQGACGPLVMLCVTRTLARSGRLAARAASTSAHAPAHDSWMRELALCIGVWETYMSWTGCKWALTVQSGVQVADACMCKRSCSMRPWHPGLPCKHPGSHASTPPTSYASTCDAHASPPPPPMHL